LVESNAAMSRRRRRARIKRVPCLVFLLCACSDVTPPVASVDTSRVGPPPPSASPPTNPPVPTSPFPLAGSFDGRIAFVSSRDGLPQTIHVTASGAIVSLTVGGDPSWSWDGQRIAFDVSELGYSSVIHIMNADGSGDHDLLLVGSLPAWSPDDKTLVFASPEGIATANVDGSGLRVLIRNDSLGLGEVSSPAWSPDGQGLAFTSSTPDPWGDGSAAIFIAKADGSEPRPLSDNAFGRPRWSPNGSMIASASVNGIVTVNADGSGFQVHAVDMPPFVGDIDWSPDGGSLLFSDYTRMTCCIRIFVVDLNGGLVQQLIPDQPGLPPANYWDWQPTWARTKSPSGQRVPPRSPRASSRHPDGAR
jgi:Tol biopolymer transport system component